MQIESLLLYLKKHPDFSALLSESKISDSVFSVLNDYLLKADKSGDDIISSDELADLFKDYSSEMLSSFELLLAELNSEDSQTESQSLTDSFFGLTKELLESNDFANIDISMLENMTRDDFVNNTGIEDFHNENLGNFWEAIGQYNPEEIFDKIDTDGDGKLSSEELAEFAAIDGDENNISITDLSSFLNPEEVLENTIEELDVTTPEVEDTSGIEPDSNVENTTPSTPSSGGSHVPGTNSYDSSNDTPSVPENKERTVEQINSEITQQETSKTNLKSEAEGKIKEQEENIAGVISESDLSDEFKAEYESENERLTSAINQKDSEIEEQKGVYQDSLALADSLKSAASDIGSQISSFESKISSLDPEKNSTLIEKYRESINNLKAEKEKLEADEQAARDKADAAKEKMGQLEEEKSKLIEEKDNILDTLSEKYEDEKEKVEKIKEDIKTYQDNIKSIRAELERNIATVDANIQTLKNEKAQLEQAPKTKEIINANRPIDRTPVALSGDIRNVDWEEYGYNAETGRAFANSAENVEARLNAKGISTQHNCLGGVKDTFIDVTGSSPFGNPGQGITVASQCLDTMRNNENYREITGISADELQYLPAGAVVVWSSSTGVSNPSPADAYGHISISMGDGRESSSTVRQQYRSVGHNGKPTVFIPIA